MSFSFEQENSSFFQLLTFMYFISPFHHSSFNPPIFPSGPPFLTYSFVLFFLTMFGDGPPTPCPPSEVSTFPLHPSGPYLFFVHCTSSSEVVETKSCLLLEKPPLFIPSEKCPQLCPPLLLLHSYASPLLRFSPFPSKFFLYPLLPMFVAVSAP